MTKINKRYCEAPGGGVHGAARPEKRLYSKIFFRGFVTF